MSSFRKEIVERAAQMMVERLDADDSDDGQPARTSSADGEAAYFDRRASKRKEEKHQRQIKTLWGGIGLASVADVVEVVQFVLDLFTP